MDNKEFAKFALEIFGTRFDEVQKIINENRLEYDVSSEEITHKIFQAIFNKKN